MKIKTIYNNSYLNNVMLSLSKEDHDLILSGVEEIRDLISENRRTGIPLTNSISRSVYLIDKVLDAVEGV